MVLLFWTSRVVIATCILAGAPMVWRAPAPSIADTPSGKHPACRSFSLSAMRAAAGRRPQSAAAFSIRIAVIIVVSDGSSHDMEVQRRCEGWSRRCGGGGSKASALRRCLARDARFWCSSMPSGVRSRRGHRARLALSRSRVGAVTGELFLTVNLRVAESRRQIVEGATG
jgi:hypothetical protein